MAGPETEQQDNPYDSYWNPFPFDHEQQQHWSKVGGHIASIGCELLVVGRILKFTYVGKGICSTGGQLMGAALYTWHQEQLREKALDLRMKRLGSVPSNAPTLP